MRLDIVSAKIKCPVESCECVICAREHKYHNGVYTLKISAKVAVRAHMITKHPELGLREISLLLDFAVREMKE